MPAWQVIWFNYRKESVVYINSSPHSPRDPADLHRNLNLQYSAEQLDKLGASQ